MATRAFEDDRESNVSDPEGIFQDARRALYPELIELRVLEDLAEQFVSAGSGEDRRRGLQVNFPVAGMTIREHTGAIGDHYVLCNVAGEAGFDYSLSGRKIFVVDGMNVLTVGGSP